MAARAQIAKAIEAGLWRTVHSPLHETLGDVPVLRHRPDGEPCARLLHFHGGGYRMGAPEIDGPFAEALVARCGIEVIVPRYRLAPEHPYPAAVNDAGAVVQALLAEPPLPLILCGGSAGAGLAAQLAAQAGGCLRALIMISPWLDLNASHASYDTNAPTDALFNREAARMAAALYLQGAEPRALAIDSFPVTQTVVGEGEVVRDEAVALHARLCEAGIGAQLAVVRGMTHIAPIRDRVSAAGQAGFEAIVDFIDAVLAEMDQQSPR